MVSVCFYFSGVFLEQLEEFAPDVLDSFKKLVDTGQVEILAETYYHSLAFLYSKGEFREQVKLHENLIKRLFGLTPKVFRNTELIYSNEVAREVEAMGYKGILSEGSDNILGWRSPNFLYRPISTKKIKVLTKNYRLSDDLAFRFSEKSWKEWPLTAPKYVERDLSAWLGNEIQHSAINKVYFLGHRVLKTKDEELIHKWRKLQTSDHFYYMCINILILMKVLMMRLLVL